MKKIVIPFEGLHFHGELLDLVKALNDKGKIFLTATFIPDADYAQLWPPRAGVEAQIYLAPPQNEEKLIAMHARRVRRFCDTHSIGYRVQEDTSDFALSVVRKETRFADLLMLSARHFFETAGEKQPNAYMQQLLHGSECPVLLLPDEPRLPGEVVLAYDGTRESVNAVRQFAYLFPEFNRLPTTLVYVDAKDKGAIPEQDLIRELGNVHFRNFRILRLNKSTEKFYDTWIGMMSSPWLVAGAFGRSDVSRIFAHSFVDRMSREHKAPVFLGHK
jgi:hypothetical protein